MSTPLRQPGSHRQQGWYCDYRTLDPDLAQALRDARLSLGLSVRRAAALAAVSPGYLSRLERGERCPRVGVAMRLAGVLDLDDDTTASLLEAVADDYPGWRQT